ncbi:hypothetical protein DPMN_078786 [Dreissena polymorpha]|uniref:Uncharacterized protein n=1 Tax=Dreissena polymorpha TaxID=45954 RepID=A0A9D4BQS1_DREPO|nr:hypothetical protein DPMN_078786 [Dreissena polymorpha]
MATKFVCSNYAPGVKFDPAQSTEKNVGCGGIHILRTLFGFEKSEEATYSYLTMTMPFWNEKSCLDLAFESNNMEFLAQQACRNIVGDIWNGRMKDKLKEVIY